MYAKTCSWFVGCALALTFVSGCTLQKKDDADEFRDAVPQSESIALAGPDSSGTTSTDCTVTPQGEAHYSVESVVDADHTGSIHVVAHVDIDDSKQTLLEDVSRSIAAGRRAAPGELTSTSRAAICRRALPRVDAVECGMLGQGLHAELLLGLRRPCAHRWYRQRLRVHQPMIA